MSYSLVALLTAASALSVPPAGAVVPPVVTVTVATGAARSLGEPVAVQDPAVSAVVATSFGPAGARALAWTRRAGEHGWAADGAILPDGFGSSYDASATAVPGGPLLVVAGTAPPGGELHRSRFRRDRDGRVGRPPGPGSPCQRPARDRQLR